MLNFTLAPFRQSMGCPLIHWSCIGDRCWLQASAGSACCQTSGRSSRVSCPFGHYEAGRHIAFRFKKQTCPLPTTINLSQCICCLACMLLDMLKISFLSLCSLNTYHIGCCYELAVPAQERNKAKAAAPSASKPDDDSAAHQPASKSQLPSRTHAVSEAANVIDDQPDIRARRPTKPAARQAPRSTASSSLQLPFVEQDDDFEAFAKSLHRYHSGVHTTLLNKMMTLKHLPKACTAIIQVCPFATHCMQQELLAGHLQLDSAPCYLQFCYSLNTVQSTRLSCPHTCKSWFVAGTMKIKVHLQQTSQNLLNKISVTSTPHDWPSHEYTLSHCRIQPDFCHCNTCTTTQHTD